MAGIPPPPPPELSAAVAWGGVAATLVVAVVLLLWGRKLGRVVLAAAGAGVGLLIAPWLAGALGLNLDLVRASAAVTLALLGLVAARLIWAGIIAALLSGAGGTVLLARYAAQIPEKQRPVFPPAETFQGWSVGLYDFAQAHVAAAWQGHGEILLAITGLIAVALLLVALIRPRLACIVTSSLLGGVGLVAAVATAAVRARPTLWAEQWARYPLPLALVGGLMLVGIIFQYRGAILTDRAKARVEAEPPNKRKTKRPTSADES